MSAVAVALRRAGELLLEPAAPARPVAAVPLEIVVTALVAGAGTTTVARGLALALRRVRPVELTSASRCGAVAAGPGTAVVRDTPAAVAAAMCHRGPGRVLVAVADARREPALAVLVREAMVHRHERVILVGNRVRDEEAWTEQGAICVPDARLGARLVDRGRRPPGGLGAAFEALALGVQERP